MDAEFVFYQSLPNIAISFLKYSNFLCFYFDATIRNSILNNAFIIFVSY